MLKAVCFFMLLFISSCGSERGGSSLQSNWYEKFSSYLLDQNIDQRIFQLKVLQQKSNECSMHQKRNLLFSLSMFRNNFAKFEKEYSRMLNNDLFEKTALLTLCEIEYSRFEQTLKKPQENEDSVRRNPKLKKFIAEHPNFRDFLPDAADQDINTIIEFKKYINEKDHSESVEYITKKIPLFEQNIEQNSAFDAAQLIKSGFSWAKANHDIEQLY